MANSQDTEKLRSLIKGIKIAMLTTAGADGIMRSRPMTTQETEFDGDLWFFTGLDAGMVDESKQNQQVNVAYSAPDKYVSVSGEVVLVKDKAKIQELWSPLFKGWFPGGVDDPNLVLLKVSVTQAEYWESSGSPVVKLVGFVQSLRGERPDLGHNEKLTLKKPAKASTAKTADSKAATSKASTAKPATSKTTTSKASTPTKTGAKTVDTVAAAEKPTASQASKLPRVPKASPVTAASAESDAPKAKSSTAKKSTSSKKTSDAEKPAKKTTTKAK